jgi:hypothetical protein
MIWLLDITMFPLTRGSSMVSGSLTIRPLVIAILSTLLVVLYTFKPSITIERERIAKRS